MWQMPPEQRYRNLTANEVEPRGLRAVVPAIPLCSLKEIAKDQWVIMIEDVGMTHAID
jgi:hypothetical protein